MSADPRPCVFCEIIAGREVASRVYEDDTLVAFMTLRPTRPGEFLVIPKAHIDHFIDVPDDVATHVLLVAQRLARRSQNKLRPQRMGYVVHGFGVAHAHLVVVPLHHSDDITSARFAQVKDGQAMFGLSHIPFTPRDELDRMARLLAAD